MPVLLDWIGNPLALVDDFFDKNLLDYSEKIDNYFGAKIKNKDDESKIPFLEISCSPSYDSKNSLVKSLCMVQDILNPSLYYDSYYLKCKSSGISKRVCGKYKNGIDIPSGYEDLSLTLSTGSQNLIPIDHIKSNALYEVHNYVAISPPGINEWAHGIANLYKESANEVPNYKLKVYDQSNQIKLNDILKIYGVLSWDEDHANNLTQTATKYQIHVIYFEIISPYNLVPHSLQCDLNLDKTFNKFQIFLHNIFQMFNLDDQLIAQYITLFILSLESLNLSSNKELSYNNSFHHLSIITSCQHSNKMIKLIDTLFQILLPISQNIVLSVEDINSKTLHPKKCYDNMFDELDACETKLGSTLSPTLLQLPPCTFTTIDMSSISPSHHFTEIGQANLRVLKQLFNTRQLEYDFKYYPLLMDSKMKTVLFASKEMAEHLDVEFKVPFQLLDNEQSSTDLTTGGDMSKLIFDRWTLDEINFFRSYVAQVHSLSLSLNTENSTKNFGRLLDLDREAIIKDFVTIRGRNVADMSAEDMQRYLMLARHLSICKGKNLTFEDWTEVKNWEESRKSRMQ